MEYVDGQPLLQVRREREAAGEPFTEFDLLVIAVSLAQGLARIHRAGVIHRDIKPAKNSGCGMAECIGVVGVNWIGGRWQSASGRAIGLARRRRVGTSPEKECRGRSALG